MLAERNGNGAQALRRRRSLDVLLLGCIVALMAIGTVAIYSASAVAALRNFGNATHFLARHVAYAAIGSLTLVFAASRDGDWLRRSAPWLLLTAIAFLAAVLVVGTRVNQAARWLRVGPLSFQPVELAKLATIVYLAALLAKKRDNVGSFVVGFLPPLLVCGAIGALLLAQPDLGSCLILGTTTLALLFIAGTPLSYLLLAVLVAAPAAYLAVVGTPWRLQRLLAFLDPWQFRTGVGYQVTQSLIAVGSGEWFGVGLGHGAEKLFYMPEAHTDFILSTIGEELGFVGVVGVLAAYVVVLWRGVRAARCAQDAFGAYLAAGLTIMLSRQALLNAAVVLGAVPAKGITLPFVSYGGTSLVASMFAVGGILSVGRGDGRL